MRDKRKTLDKKSENLKFKKLAKKQKMQERGITLIALVVTIIILLILAGVTLNMALSDNGLFKKTKEATEKYQMEADREALEMLVMSYRLGENKEGESSKLGKKLADRNLTNSSTWDIIVEKSDSKTYGTGWYYIGKGEEVEGIGKTKNAWVVNYETGEIVELEDDSYNNFNYKSSIAVTGGIIYNLDSANVGLDKKSWGDNAKLYYYDDKEYNTDEKRQQEYEKQKTKTVEDENPGYDRQESADIGDYIDKPTGAFKFNGNNYIELKKEDGFDFSNGFTYEYYGKINNYKFVFQSDNKDKGAYNYCGLFALWNGVLNESPTIRVGMHYEQKCLFYNLIETKAMKDDDGNAIEDANEYGSWSNDKRFPWNQFCKFDLNELENDVFLTVTFSPGNGDSQSPTQTVYLNGEVLDSGFLGKKYYDEFVKAAKKLNYFEIGRCSMNDIGQWSYGVGLCYSLRLYNKALDKEDVKKNYDVTTDFHKYIIDSKNE